MIADGVWVRPRRPDQSEMQYQVRNWYYFTWLCGDHVVEQHVHDINVCNWIAQSHPVEAEGMGGRQVRIGKDFGEIFDHHAVEFTYPSGLKAFSYCRHIPGCWQTMSEHAHGTKGRADLDQFAKGSLTITGQKPERWPHGPDGHQVEWNDLLAAMAAGQPYNEVDRSILAHNDGHSRPHGHVLGQSRHMGRGDQLATQSGAAATHLGRQAPGAAAGWPLCVRYSRRHQILVGRRIPAVAGCGSMRTFVK